MGTHSPIFLLIGILALCLPALFLACAGEEPTGSTPRRRVAADGSARGHRQRRWRGRGRHVAPTAIRR